MVGVWDIGGGQSTQLVLQQIYQLVRFQSIVYLINPEKTVQEGVGSPAISQIDFSKVHLNRLLAEIELEQVSNVHIFYNINKVEGRFRNVFEGDGGGENRSSTNTDKSALIRFFNNKLDHQDLETTYSTVKFHYEIVDVNRDDRQTLQKHFGKVIQSQYMAAAD